MDRLMAAASDANQIKLLSRASKLQLHAMGIVVREFPPILMRVVQAHVQGASWQALLNRARNPTARARVNAAERAHAMLIGLVAHHGMCTAPIQQTFSTLVLSGGFRTDSTIALGMRINSNADFHSKPTAVAAWARCDHQDNINDDGNGGEAVELQLQCPLLNTKIRQHRVAEIDLTCVAAAPPAARRRTTSAAANFVHTRGGGRALLTHVLARIAERKQNGARRFVAVITYLAVDAHGNKPLLPALRSMGFTPVASSWKRADGAIVPTGRDYYVLQDDPGNSGITWQRKAANSIAWSHTMQAMCPLEPRSGATYCT